VAVIEWWLEVTSYAQKLLETARKPVPVQTSRVHVPLLVDKRQLVHLSQQKTDGSADGKTRMADYGQ